MYPDTAVHVHIVFSDVAQKALDLEAEPPPSYLPANFMARAQFAVPGDFVKLHGSHGLFIVSHRIWEVASGRTTLKLVLDVLVQDGH